MFDWVWAEIRIFLGTQAGEWLCRFPAPFYFSVSVLFSACGAKSDLLFRNTQWWGSPENWNSSKPGQERTSMLRDSNDDGEMLF